MISRFHRAFVRFAAFLVRRISMGLGFSDVAFIMLIDGLEMVIGRRNVMGCGEVMMFT